MPTYLKFHELERSPFEGEAGSRVVLGTKALRDSLATIRLGLEEGAARICVNGSGGMGKTSLACALPKLLDEGFRVAVILHPEAPWNTHRGSIAKQWCVGEGGLARSALLESTAESRLVLVIDDAENASDDFLDHLDVLLSYRTEADEPVVQSVLFANLTLAREGQDGSAQPSPLIWWLDRIQTLELQFAALPREGVESYIQKHLKRAGWQGESLFSSEAAEAIHGYAGGIPGKVGRFCEVLLKEAASRDLRLIDASLVHEILDLSTATEANAFDDEFEELVGEEEFVGADQSEEAVPSANPTLRETLERFSEADPNEATPTEAEDSPVGAADVSDPPVAVDAAEAFVAHDGAADEGDSSPFQIVTSDLKAGDSHGISLPELEAFLSSPASDDELRALGIASRGGWVRIAAGIAIAVALGAMTLNWLRSEPAPPSGGFSSQLDTFREIETPKSRRAAGADGSPQRIAENDGQPLILAKVRGPVESQGLLENTSEADSRDGEDPKNDLEDINTDPTP